MSPDQKILLEFCKPPGGVLVVNDRVSIHTEESRRVVLVHGVIVAHYDQNDHATEEYAMLTLLNSGYAAPEEIASAFNCSSRSIRRYSERFESGVLHALGRGKGRPMKGEQKKPDERDQTILRMKDRGFSNRGIAQRLGLAENSVRKRLRRLGWEPQPDADLPFLEKTDPSVLPDMAGLSQLVVEPPGNAVPESATASEQTGASFAVNPLDRSLDRLLAAMGQLEDATPMFARTKNLSGAGVLLAIQALIESGLLSVARKIYGSLGPAFYGLRTTLVTSVLLALLRIPRPETLKEYSPGDLGRIVGLDRIPEVKTLRRKLAQLAAMKKSRELGLEMARLRIAERGRTLGFLYVDGHVREYHGKRTIPKAYVTRKRIAAPGTTDYWINDQKGDPLFVVTAEANAAMTHMLVPILKEVRTMIGTNRRLTVVFDRGGWSPKLFESILDMHFDVLTYRKGRFPRIAEKRFVLRKARIEGRPVKYLLHDQAVRFLKGKLRLRQVTRLAETKHQTAVITSRWDLRDIVVAYRMFDRWRQENFFKYMRQEFILDALVDYDAEPDDPNRSIPNPARKAVDKELHVNLAPLRSPHRSKAIALVCDTLNKTETIFPGTNMRIIFSVSEPDI